MILSIFANIFVAMNILSFIAVCQLVTSGTCSIHQNFATRGKGLTSQPLLDWLQGITIPLPSYTYNKSAVEAVNKVLKSREDFIFEINEWIRFLDYSPLKNLNWSDPSTFICSTAYDLWDTNYTDHTRWPCPNGSFVSTPWYVADWMSYSLPGQVCATRQEPPCSIYINSTLSRVNATGDLLRELKSQKKEIDKNNTISRYQRTRNIIGVGYNVSDSYKARINDTLYNLDPFTAAGTQAATTIAALIPALLTVGNLFVPKSSEIFATSFCVGIMSAMFSLGLPVSSLSGIKSNNRFEAGSWGFKARRSIERFGQIKPRAVDGTKNTPCHRVDLAELQKWSKEHCDPGSITDEQAATELTFSDLKKQVLLWKRRAHFSAIPAVVVACVQAVLFIFTIGPLYFGAGTPLLLFDGRGYWTSAWLFVAAGVSAIFRIFMWERGSHERVKLYAMTATAQERFHWFAHHDPGSTQQTPTAYVEDSMPPLYPPLLAVIESAVWRAIYMIVPGLDPAQTHGRRKSAMQGNLAVRQKNTTVRKWEVVWHDLRNPKQFLQKSFNTSKPPAAAPRWRPLYLLMHLSTSGRNPIWTLLTGLVEGFILILLTVFFAAQWGKTYSSSC